MGLRDYQQLIAWQRAMDLTESVYRATQRFPREEIYGLTAQLRRAAMSVPSNIAEGQGRRTTGEFLQFLGHATGSLQEVETQILIAQRLAYLDEQTVLSLMDCAGEVGRISNGLVSSLERRT